MDACTAPNAEASSQATFQSLARRDLEPLLAAAYREKLGWFREGGQEWPMVYSERYNITFWGLEKLHPFDACKYRRVVAALRKQFPQMRLLGAPRASRELLEDVHTQEYLRQLEASSRKVAEVTELAFLACMPSFLLQARVVVPMQYHTGGTVLAAAAAIARGWAVNLGGGMHHACRNNGQGWCPYDDLYLAVRQLRRASAGAVRTAMIIDTDAHQGNGYARDKLAFGDPDVFIVDAYNSDIFPLDQPAKQAIDVEVALHTGCDDTQYLADLDKALQSAFARCTPHIILYNAGTDPLAGDPLGRMQVSAAGILKRDMMVWQAALRHRVPICMVLSGGYSKDSAQVIHHSLAQLLHTFQLAS